MAELIAATNTITTTYTTTTTKIMPPSGAGTIFWLGGQKFIKTSVQNAEDIKTRKTLIEFEH